MEFLRLVIDDIMRKSPLFEGPIDSRFLSLDAECLDQNTYFYAGQLIAMSIARGGPGPNCLSKEMVQALFRDQSLAKRTLSIELIFDNDLKEELKAFQKIEDLDSLQRFVVESSMAAIGGIGSFNVQHVNDKEKIIQATLKFLLIHRIQPAFQQFLAGLNTLNVFHTLLPHEEVYTQFFEPYQSALTKSIVYDMFELPISNSRIAEKRTEERIKMHFQYYLESLEVHEKKKKTGKEEEEGMKNGKNEIALLEDVVVFVTGLKREPPFGWKNKPALKFIHDAVKDKNPHRLHLPEANTCSLTLHLPTQNASYEKFCEAMNKAVLWCKHILNE